MFIGDAGAGGLWLLGVMSVGLAVPAPLVLSTRDARADPVVHVEGGLAIDGAGESAGLGFTLGGGITLARWAPFAGVALVPRAGILFSRHHSGFDGDGNEPGSRVLDSLQVPLVLTGEFTIGRRAFHVVGGAYGSAVLRSQRFFRSADGAIGPVTLAHRVDLGWLAGGGFELLSVAGGTVFFEARYQRGQRRLWPDRDATDRSVLVVVGYGLSRDSNESPSQTAEDSAKQTDNRDNLVAVRAGLIASRLRAAESTASSYRPGFVLGGAFVPVRLGSRVALAPQLEIAYVHRQGADALALAGAGTDPDGSIAWDTLDLAMLARGEWATSRARFYGLAGVYGSVLFSAQRTERDRITDIRDAASVLDVGWSAGAGIEVQRWARFSLELRYQRGLRDLLPTHPGEVTQQSVQVVFGIGQATGRRSRTSANGPEYRIESNAVVLRGSGQNGDKAASASARVTSVGIGRPGDRWASALDFTRIERATRDGRRGYQVTYPIAGHGDEVIFWPRDRIDLAGKSPGYRGKYRKLKNGRLRYPDRVTRRSLPRVHHYVLVIERAYAAQAKGAQRAMQGFAVIAGLGGVKPTLRRIAPRAPPRAPIRTSGRVASRSAPKSTATPAPATPAPAPTPPAPAPAATAATTATAAVAPSSRVLGKALEAAGHVRPPGAAAHHIVAGAAKRAHRAREVLRHFGIGINDAVNGVFLPATRASPNPTGAAVHSTLHTKRYYDAVNEALQAAGTRAEAEAILRSFRQLLLSGGL